MAKRWPQKYKTSPLRLQVVLVAHRNVFTYSTHQRPQVAKHSAENWFGKQGGQAGYFRSHSH